MVAHQHATSLQAITPLHVPCARMRSRRLMWRLTTQSSGRATRAADFGRYAAHEDICTARVPTLIAAG